MSKQFQKQLTTAIQLFEAGRLREAEQFARRALAVDPTSADALHILGVIAGCLTRYSDAELFLKRAAAIDLDNHAIPFNLAKALSDQGKDGEALDWHKRAIALGPKNDGAWLNFGISLYRVERFDLAIAAFDRALEINASLAEAYTNKANCLRAKGALEESVQCHRRAIDLKPQMAEAWLNHGAALNDLKQFTRALTSIERAIELKPDYAEAWSNAGNSLRDLRRYDEALTRYDRAVELNPSYCEAWLNRGELLARLGEDVEAIKSYDKCIVCCPDRKDAYYNKGILQLRYKNFKEGFKNYRHRWETERDRGKRLNSRLPEPIEESPRERLLVWAEQGLGDEVFYSGWIKQTLERFPSLSLSSDKRLHPILARSFPAVDLLDREALGSLDVDSSFDRQIAMGDLPFLNLENLDDTLKNSRCSFFKTDIAKTTRIKSAFPFNSRKLVCGLSWRSFNKEIGDQKSIDLLKIMPALRSAEMEFVSLQYGDVSEEIKNLRKTLGLRVHEMENIDLREDIDSLLSLIEACDLVITCSNVTAHLAGSIGKLGAVLVPYSLGRIWYWHKNDTFSFWYPSLRVFYQSERNGWDGAMADLSTWINENYLKNC